MHHTNHLIIANSAGKGTTLIAKNKIQAFLQSSVALGIIGESFFSAIFFSYIALELSWPKFLAYENHSAVLRALVFALGGLLGLLFVGLMREKATNVNLFTWGLIGTTLSFFLTFCDKILFYSFVSVSHTLVTCATMAILILAWCERISLKTPKERSLLLAVDSLFVVLLTTLALATNINSTILIIELFVFISVSAERYILKSEGSYVKSQAKKASSLPHYLLLILFLFGFAQSSLCLLSRKAIGGEASLPLEVLPVFLPLWILFIAATIAFVLFLFFQKKLATHFFSVLAPLLSIGLLLPPYFLLGSQEMLRAVIIFIIICEVSVCSIGPSNAKWVIGKGVFTFVFWQRSLGFIGAIIGYAITSFWIEDISIQSSGGIVAILVYVSICLTVVTLLERTKFGMNAANSSEKKSFKNTCLTLSSRYGLTARETEVFMLVARGRTLPYVQKKLCIAPGTAATHIDHIYKKIGINTRQELISMIENETK